jgi:hypothetical protein
MRQENSKRIRGGRGFLALALAFFASVLAVGHAEPAHARNDFQNGFEDQLGRIVAGHVYAVGAQVLGGGYVPVVAPAVYYTPPPVYYAPPPVYYAPVVYAPAYYGPSHGGYYGHPHKVKVRHVVHHRGNSHGHGKGKSHGHGNDYGHGRGRH